MPSNSRVARVLYCLASLFVNLCDILRQQQYLLALELPISFYLLLGSIHCIHPT